MSKLKINIELEIPDEWNFTQDDISDSEMTDAQVWLNVVALLTEKEQVDIHNYHKHTVNIELI